MVSRTLTVNNPEGLQHETSRSCSKGNGENSHVMLQSYLEIRESTQRVLLILFLALRKVQK